MWFTKLKAGALQVTLGIVVVMALLLTGFVLLVHTHKLFNKQTDVLISSIHETHYGLDYALQNQLKLNDTIIVDTSADLEGELKLHRSFWGVFEKVISDSKLKTYQAKTIALIGATQPIERSRIICTR